MNRQTNTLLALAGAVVLVAGTAAAQQAAPAKQQTSTTAKPTGTAGQATAAPAARLAAPIRGVANLGVTKPVTKSGKVDGKDFIITTMKVKNMSAGSIAGLKADEFWLDKGGQPVGGDTFRYRKPLQPNEVIEITFSTPRDAKMSTNQYRFSHANGDIKTQLVPKL